MTHDTNDDAAAGSGKPYYAKDGKVWKAPIETKIEGGSNFEIGFPVCRMEPAAGDGAASTVAKLMNLGHAMANTADSESDATAGDRAIDAGRPIADTNTFEAIRDNLKAALKASEEGRQQAERERDEAVQRVEAAERERDEWSSRAVQEGTISNCFRDGYHRELQRANTAESALATAQRGRAEVLEAIEQCRKEYKNHSLHKSYWDACDDIERALAGAPERQPEGQAPIPEAIYYSVEHDNFYSFGQRQGMGNVFYIAWRQRAEEFPTEPVPTTTCPKCGLPTPKPSSTNEEDFGSFLSLDQVTNENLIAPASTASMHDRTPGEFQPASPGSTNPCRCGVEASGDSDADFVERMVSMTTGDHHPLLLSFFKGKAYQRLIALARASLTTPVDGVERTYRDQLDPGEPPSGGETFVAAARPVGVSEAAVELPDWVVDDSELTNYFESLATKTANTIGNPAWMGTIFGAIEDGVAKTLARAALTAAYAVDAPACNDAAIMAVEGLRAEYQAKKSSRAKTDDDQPLDFCDIAAIQGVRVCDRVLAVLRALPQSGEAPGWCFDMEKAPRDGTPLLLGGGDVVVAGRFVRGSDYNPLVTMLAGERGYWQHLGSASRVGEPTAWMPLPAPPIPAQEGAK